MSWATGYIDRFKHGVIVQFHGCLPAWIWVVLFGLAASGCNAQGKTKADAKAYCLQADSLLQLCFAAYGITDSSLYLHAWYHVGDPTKVIADAKLAEDRINKALAINNPGLDLIECWRKVAWCNLLQNRDFAYQDSLPQGTLSALGRIDLAIDRQHLSGRNRKLAVLYENAACLAIPHFYYGYQSFLSVQMESRAYGHLEQAAKLYIDLGDLTAALRCLRLVHNEDVAFVLRKVELAKRIDPLGSLAFAEDVSQLFHSFAYQEMGGIDTAMLEDDAALAIESFRSQPQPLSEEDAGRFRTLLGRVGYCDWIRKNDVPKAIKRYLEAQALEEAYGEQLYYNAFYLGAMYIVQREWDLADAQYEKALKDAPKLSVTDEEHAYFGKALVAWMRNEKGRAKEIWRDHIPDKEIMNGVSGFQSRFHRQYKAEIRKQALELIKAVGARNALRIVNNDWIE